MRIKEGIYTQDVITNWRLSEPGSADRLGLVDLENREVKGVGVIIVADDGKILMVEESQDKPLLDKKAGDWGIPMETKMKTEEGDIEADEETLRRLIKEETGLVDVEAVTLGNAVCQGDYMIGVDKPIWCRVFVVHCSKSSSELQMVTDRFVAEKDDVSKLMWMNPKKYACLPKRRGIVEMVGDYNLKIDGNGDGYRFIREACVPGFRLGQ